MTLECSSYKSPDTINSLRIDDDNGFVGFRLFQSGHYLPNTFIERVDLEYEKIPELVGFLNAIYSKHINKRKRPVLKKR